MKGTLIRLFREGCLRPSVVGPLRLAGRGRLVPGVWLGDVGPEGRVGPRPRGWAWAWPQLWGWVGRDSSRESSVGLVAHLQGEGSDGVVLVFDQGFGRVLTPAHLAGSESVGEGERKRVDIIKLEIGIELEHVFFGHELNFVTLVDRVFYGGELLFEFGVGGKGTGLEPGA